MTETLHFSPIGKEDLKTSPRNGTFEVTLADGSVETLSAVDVAYFLADAYTEATLPTTGVATGQLARVTDEDNDLRMWTGAAWVSVTKITTRGDLVYGETNGVPTRLAIGAAGRLLSSDGTEPTWGQGPLTTTGDLLIGATAGTPTRLAVGAANRVLRSDGSTPAWGQIVTADITDGDVTVAKIQRTEASAENAGVVTVTGGTTEIVTVDCGTVTAGDRIFVMGTAQLSKGGTAGKTEISIALSTGTATIATFHDGTVIREQENSHALSTDWDATVSGIVKVTGSGTLTLVLNGVSAGSDATVGAGEGQIYAWVVPGA